MNVPKNPTTKFEIPKDKAMELYESEFWKPMSYRERAVFQMFCEQLCMPFDVFHEAVTKALGRDVYTHEFGLNRDGLIAELNGTGASPTFEEVLSMIPEDKRVIVLVGEADEGE